MPLIIATLLAVILVAVVYRWPSKRPEQHRELTIRVPGRTWRWKRAPPITYRILGCMFAINVLCAFLLLVSISFWGATAPDATRTVAVNMRGGDTYYATRVVGYYIWSAVPAAFALFASMAVVTWIHRDDLEAVGPDQNHRAR